MIISADNRLRITDNDNVELVHLDGTTAHISKRLTKQ